MNNDQSYVKSPVMASTIETCYVTKGSKKNVLVSDKGSAWSGTFVDIAALPLFLSHN